MGITKGTKKMKIRLIHNPNTSTVTKWYEIQNWDGTHWRSIEGGAEKDMRAKFKLLKDPKPVEVIEEFDSDSNTVLQPKTPCSNMP